MPSVPFPSHGVPTRLAVKFADQMGRLQDETDVNTDNASTAGSDLSSRSSDKESLKVLLALSTTMERLVQRNESSRSPSSDESDRWRDTVYHGTRAPGISIGKYLQRIHRYTSCSPSCFVVGFVYIDQLIHKQPDFPLILLNVHRLLLTSIMVATKFLDDLHYSNAFYAKVGGISVSELNSLEINFLSQLNFRLHVTTSTFEAYCTHLERELLLSSRGLEIDRTMQSHALATEHPHKQKDVWNAIPDAHAKVKLWKTTSKQYVTEHSPSPTMWSHFH